MSKAPVKKVQQQQPRRRPVYPEEDVVAIMRALDSSEVAASTIARQVSQNDDVLAFAAVMVKDHSDIMRLIDQTGVRARSNAISGQLLRDADSLAHGFSTLSTGFNNTYAEQEVSNHQKALQLLDTVIIPSATTPEFRSLVERVRPTIAAHLQRALQILALRHKQAEERGEPWQSGFPTPEQRDSAARAAARRATTPAAQPDTSPAPPITTTTM